MLASLNFTSVFNRNLNFLFVLVPQSISEMEAEEQRRKDKCCSHGLTYQPQLYAVGSRCPDYFIKFDDICWKFGNPLKAIDVAFKTFQVLNLNYPFECQLIWGFIQQRVYSIFTKYDSKSPCLAILLNSTK